MTERAALFDLLGYVVLGEAIGLAAVGVYVLAEQAYRRWVLRRAVLLLMPAPVACTRPPALLVTGGVFVRGSAALICPGPATGAVKTTKHDPRS